ncbi:MAG: hypothetical protein WD054_03125, partial [Gemmatimonadota bacterium]
SMPQPLSACNAGGEWVWDREALLREAPISLSDLLDRIPGVTAVRAGQFAQPEAAAAFGGTAGRLEIVVDGYVLDPLAASSFDLAQVPLGQLREVRVERRLGLLRIHLLTEQPAGEQPYTRVEAGVGEPIGTLFRGVFLVPYVIAGPLGLGIERLDGGNPNEPADVFNGWAKWSWTNGMRGVQLEWLRTTTQREPSSPWVIDRVRQDFIVRARTGLADGLFAEVYAGRSTTEETVPGSATEENEEDVSADRSSLQAGVRGAWQLPWAVLGGSLRYRDAAALPSTEAMLDAAVALGPLRLYGEAARAAWRDADATTYTSLHAEVGRLLGASAFAEITRGDRGAPHWGSDSTVDPDPAAAIIGNREGWRAGVALQLGERASGSIARISLEQDMSRPFGLPFDTAGAASPAETATGVEAHGRLVLLPDLLSVESWITDWTGAAGWAYLPSRTWRTALTLHTLPLPSGNLEILGRLEATQRGGMLAFHPEPVEGETVTSIPSYTIASGYLHIRVIDVRAFLRYEDLLGTHAESLPGRIIRGPRIFYGVKWDLWN